MTTLMKIAGWTLVAVGAIWIVYVLVAVATGMQGYHTLQGLIGPVAFHAVTSSVGLELVGRAKARAGARVEQEPVAA
jgi:multisubunit Na+/H+ antiporter MnhG subunit